MKQEETARSISLFQSARRLRRLSRWSIAAGVLLATLLAGYAIMAAASSSSPPLTSSPGENPKAPEPPENQKRNTMKTGDAEAVKTPTLPEPEDSCDDPRVLVDQSHPLPPDYAPQDLVPLASHGVPVRGGEQFLRREAAEKLSLLVADAAADGEELIVASAYRSYADQQSSYEYWTNYYGYGAGGMSAPAGHSQHQLGTAVDFTNAATEYKVHQNFGYTTPSRWLEKNAPRYGFVLAYPKGNEGDTGYNWEPWHYRYVGENNAERISESGLKLHAYLSREGVLPRC